MAVKLCLKEQACSKAANNQARKFMLKIAGAEKRKPAFNHPDHAGLITTSNVTSLKTG